MKCCVSTDVGTWTNWLTFEPDPDYSPDAGTGLLSPISYKLLHGILRPENPMYTCWWPAARANRGFKMVSFTEPSEHLCWRYMRSVECPSSVVLNCWLLLHEKCMSGVNVVSRWSLPTVGSVWLCCHTAGVAWQKSRRHRQFSYTSRCS